MLPRIGTVGGPGGKNDSRLPHRSTFKIPQKTTIPTRIVESIAGRERSKRDCVCALKYHRRPPLSPNSGLPPSHKSTFGSHRVWFPFQQMNVASAVNSNRLAENSGRMETRKRLRSLRSHPRGLADRRRAEPRSRRRQNARLTRDGSGLSLVSHLVDPTAVDLVSSNTLSLTLLLHTPCREGWQKIRGCCKALFSNGYENLSNS
jgi:hypothetical protein